MSKDVFISYKSDEFGIASYIYEELKRNGISAWMAPQDIPGGSSYAMEITKAIKGCKIFLLVLSKAAQTSQWIPKEIDNAINEKKLILPFMVEKCNLNAEFSFLLSNIQFKDGYTNREEALNRLIAEMKQYLGIKDTPPHAASPKTKAASPEAEKVSAVPPEKIIEFVGKQLNGENPPVPTAEKKKDEPKRKAYSPYEKKDDIKAEAPAEKKPEPSAAAVAAEKTSSSFTYTKSKKKKSKKKILIISAAVLLVFICVVAISLSDFSFSPSVVIAGEEYTADDSYLYLREKTITEEDMLSIASFENLTDITFTDCTITAQSFNPDVLFDFSSIEIKNCNMSQEFYDSLKIGSYPNLYDLDISGNPLITDLGINEGELPKLRYLNISGTSVENIDTVYNSCKSIASLNISGTKIRDISFLEGNQEISELGIADLELYSLESLSEMIYLREIDASGNPVGSIDALSNCVLFTNVNFSGCGISSISVLEKSSEYLTEAILADNSISDLSPLKDCTKLTVLDVTSNSISSLEALSALTELKKLYASDNAVSSVTGIEALTNMIVFDLSGNNLTKITSTLVFAEGASVYLNDNELTELSLSSEYRYNTLSLHNNNLTDGKYLEGISAFSLTADYSESLNTETLNSGFTSVTIYGCPLDKQAEMSSAVYGVTFEE